MQAILDGRRVASMRSSLLLALWVSAVLVLRAHGFYDVEIE
jgi:hypothetical protein